jgi:hypothetical protein
MVSFFTSPHVVLNTSCHASILTSLAAYYLFTFSFFTQRENRVCRAFYFGRTAKSLFAVRFLYIARQRKNTHQTSCLPCASGKRTAKISFAVRFYYSARQSIFSPYTFRVTQM